MSTLLYLTLSFFILTTVTASPVTTRGAVLYPYANDGVVTSNAVTPAIFAALGAANTNVPFFNWNFFYFAASLSGSLPLYTGVNVQPLTVQGFAPAGTLYMRNVYTAYDPDRLLDVFTREIRAQPAQFNASSFTATWALLVTWGDMNTANNSKQALTAPKNTYQYVIVTDGCLSFGFYLYNKLQWLDPTWKAGYEFQDCANVSLVPADVTDPVDAMEYLLTQSNVGTPGKFIVRYYPYVSTEFLTCSSNKQMPNITVQGRPMWGELYDADKQQQCIRDLAQLPTTTLTSTAPAVTSTNTQQTSVTTTSGASTMASVGRLIAFALTTSLLLL